MTLRRKLDVARKIARTEGPGGVLRLILRNLPGVVPAIARLFPRTWKEWNELDFWKSRKRLGTFSNDHFEHFFTRHFGIDRRFYAGKRLLDIGCGPMGSLEWADGALERVGMDPLAADYLKLAADAQEMQYVTALSESIPFEDEHFDVVSTFNALDHVEDLRKTVAEIQRVLKPGGLFLLMTDVNHDATDCEPQEISWDVVDLFRGALDVLDEKHYERHGETFYETFEPAVPYDHANPAKRTGTLSVKFRKTDTPGDG